MSTELIAGQVDRKKKEIYDFTGKSILINKSFSGKLFVYKHKLHLPVGESDVV